LNYFQGYHDIMSVLYLTYMPLPNPTPRSRSTSQDGSLSKEAVVMNEKPDGGILERPETANGDGTDTTDRDSLGWRTLRDCAEVLSLCRVRDAMGKGMEPMMGLLRILKRILKAADPDVSRFSSHISPVPTLPFFALSWILCLFSHDVDTLEPIQRMFDYLLSRNPISAIYLAVAILVAKKPQMFKLAKKLGPEAIDDPSLLHPLFSRLPPLFPDTPDNPAPPATGGGLGNIDIANLDEDANPYEPIALSQIFAVADNLMLRFPWDGPVIRGREILGNGSVVSTYEQEAAEDWSLHEAVRRIDNEIVIPGAAAMDEEEEEEEVPLPPRRRRPTWTIRMPRNRIGTAVAVSIVFVGIGIAVFGVRAGGSRADWARWWAMVIRGWASKGGRLGDQMGNLAAGWARVGTLVGQSLKDLL